MLLSVRAQDTLQSENLKKKKVKKERGTREEAWLLGILSFVQCLLGGCEGRASSWPDLAQEGMKYCRLTPQEPTKEDLKAVVHFIFQCPCSHD